MLAHAFSDYEYPFYSHLNLTDTAEKLSDFVINNNLDGVAVEIMDRSGIENTSNSEWILNFSKTLRNRLPNGIIAYRQFPTDFISGMSFNPILP